MGTDRMRIFLCGDVMLGRGVDQVLPSPCSPELHENYVRSAVDYVRLAERANGPIPAPVDLPYVWGAALEELERRQPDARIINLETSITRSGDFESKGINYRMSPENAAVLAAACIDCCVLANNHVLDWGRSGLLDTLRTLDGLNIKHAGAGRDAVTAREPAVLDRGAKGRVLVLAMASITSGVPPDWAALPGGAGVNLLPDFSEATAGEIGAAIAEARRPNDIVIASIHWGPNWGYKVVDEQRRFAHALIDRAQVSIVHGHSSHHAKAIEVHRERLILHGCGDFLNDYEGIAGYEEYRGDLTLMYFPEVDCSTGRVVALDLVPLQIRRFRLHRASTEGADWLMRTLDRESRRYGAGIVRSQGESLKLVFAPS